MFIIHSRSPSPIPEIINIKKRKAEDDIYYKEKEEIKDSSKFVTLY
jgi:hypothetical protein